MAKAPAVLSHSGQDVPDAPTGTRAATRGAGPLSDASPETLSLPLSLPLAFAAGAVLASLADTLMPEAYEQG